MIEINYNGRLGNILFVSIGASILAQKYDLKVLNYTTPGPVARSGGRTQDPLILTDKIIETLGLSYYSGNHVYGNAMEVHDENFCDVLENPQKYCNTGIKIVCAHFQHSHFVTKYRKAIKDHFKNIKYTPTDEDDLLVNVRIGDMVNTIGKYVPDLNYYLQAINNIKFKKGYIITDSPDHPIALALIERFKLELFEGTAAEQILFAKNFNNLVLSSGTFAWWIGFLSNAKNIYYAKSPLPWTGDIHVYPEWKGLTF